MSRVYVKTVGTLPHMFISRGAGNLLGFFQSETLAELAHISGKKKHSNKQEKVVDDILSLMGKLSLEGQAELLRQLDLPKVTALHFGDWMEVETNVNVRDGMVEDATEIKEEESYGVADVAEKDDDDVDTISTALIPLVSAVAAPFSNIGEIFVNSNIPGAAACLRCAKRGIESEEVKRGGEQTRNTNHRSVEKEYINKADVQTMALQC